ncbi:MAG TPA: hypothetical protein VGJ26_18400 [Pirellulales bacterium]|jgi:hypothetical protein
MSTASQSQIIRGVNSRSWVTLSWAVGFALFAVPLVLQSLALQTDQPGSPSADAESTALMRRSTTLVLASLFVALATAGVLAISWNRVVRRIGNGGLATIAMIAGMQFTVAYAARMIGIVAGVVLGPYYLYIDGLGSKGISCLLLGTLVTLLPLPGVLALVLATVFVLNAITNGQLGLVSLLFIAVTIALHELFAAVLGVTAGPARPAIRDMLGALPEVTWSFAIRVGLAIGLAQCVSLLAQYEMYKTLLRFDFDLSYKISVSVITGLIYGGVGAACGAFLGGRLRKVAS